MNRSNCCNNDCKDCNDCDVVPITICNIDKRYRCNWPEEPVDHFNLTDYYCITNYSKSFLENKLVYLNMCHMAMNIKV